MKFKMVVDCTPEEARQFFGLPDVKPMQDAMLAKMQQQMNEATANFSPEVMMKTWLSLMPSSPEQIPEIIGRMFAGNLRPGSSLVPKPDAGRGK
jgi:hypothetical protein